jgi:acyl-CoA dehydrogenase
MKLQQTELLRKAVADGMDVMGGAALCRGPRNLIAHGHVGAPIGITVEGANILTRTLIIYGQGAIRCHPYAQREMEALEKGDGRGFVAALFGHALFFVSNAARSACLGLTRGRLLTRRIEGPLGRYAKLVAWASADFAALSDLAMMTNGSRLKLRGKLTGRFADWLSHLYLAVCVLRRFEAEGRRAEDLPLARFALEESLLEMQRAREGILRHLRVPGVGFFLREPLSAWARLNPFGTGPRDEDGAACARVLLTPSEQRDRLTGGLFLPEGANEPLARLEGALRLTAAAAPLLDRLRQASRAGTLPKASPETLVVAALHSGVITPEEARLIDNAAAARRQAIEVDSFSPEEYFGRAPSLAQATVRGTHDAPESVLAT